MKLAALRSVGAPGQLSTVAAITLAIAVYSVGIVFWALALRRFSLGVAYSVTSLSHAGVLWGSFYWFGEHISGTRCAGAALTFIGVLVVVLTAPRAADPDTAPSAGSVSRRP
jgi:multidrug transporter EmrE-like cation transporter